MKQPGAKTGVDSSGYTNKKTALQPDERGT
jgi:hypothetical protein